VGIYFSLCHMYRQVGLLQHNLLVVCDAVMEQENFEKLMAEIQKSKTDVEKHLAATVADLKREISTAQEKHR